MKLYKYCKYSENLLGTLAKNTVWLSSASKFNDIFDCKYRRAELSKEQLDELKILDSHRRSNENYVPLICTNKSVDESLDNISNIEFENIQEFIGLFGIMSLSEVPDSLLLWAHYGDNHSGICLEYDIPKELENALLPVNYSTQYPMLSIYEFGIDIVKAVDSILSTKSMEWAYEKEWRYTKPNSANTEINNPFKPTAVIFGARVQSNQKDTIRAILNARNVRFKSAVQSKSGFSINIEQEPIINTGNPVKRRSKTKAG